MSAVPGVQPLRVFPLLLPLWRVEVSTTFWDAQPYEVFDQYLARAIGQAGLRDSARLAGFFGVEPALVHRALRFLQTIGHVRHEGSGLVLTDLGQRSVQDGCRYVRKEDRQVLFFDGFRGEPLPATHYAKSVWLDDPELTLGNVRFQVVTGSPNFRMEGLAELSRRPDGERFNLPGSLTELTPLEVGTAWLPAYVVECVSDLLVYIKALDAADPYLAEVVTPYLKPVLELEPTTNDRQIWTEWLAGKGYRDAPLRRLPNQVLRASLPAGAFFGGRMEWWRLGSFETRKHSFLQVWCEDEEARRTAVLERTATRIRGRTVRDPDEIGAILAEQAALLDVATPSVDEVRSNRSEEPA